jgi:hypothetical protein
MMLREAAVTQCTDRSLHGQVTGISNSAVSSFCVLGVVRNYHEKAYLEEFNEIGFFSIG